MAILFDDFVWLHTPKTGGSWVRRQLLKAPAAVELSHPGFLVHVEIAPLYQLADSAVPDEALGAFVAKTADGTPVPLPEVRARLARMATGGKLPIAAFVRNPLSWWTSFWRYRMREGWDEKHPIDRVCKSEVFVEFITNVLEHHPGWYSRMLEHFVGTATEPISFIGKYERLHDDLLAFMEIVGIAHSADEVRSAPPVNASRVPVPDFPEELQERLKAQERPTLQRFY